MILTSTFSLLVLNARHSCEGLLQEFLKESSQYLLRIPRTTVEDVRKRLSYQAFPEFLAFLRKMAIFIDEDELVPYEFGGKYLSKGLKPGNAFIAGYSEWVGADYLVTENRKDFINDLHLFPFKVITAERFLQKHAH